MPAATLECNDDRAHEVIWSAKCYSGACQQLGRAAAVSVLLSVSRAERPRCHVDEAPCRLQSIGNVAGQAGVGGSKLGVKHLDAHV